MIKVNIKFQIDVYSNHSSCDDKRQYCFLKDDCSDIILISKNVHFYTFSLDGIKY